MQKRWLKDFEFFINPATWNVAQDLVQGGCVKSLREVEKHFWVCLVQDGESAYEVEVMLTPHKIKAYTCECWASSSRRLMCAHVAATLLKVRHFLQKNAAERVEKPEKKNSAAAKLSIQNILLQAEPEALAAFVQEYARTDRDFSLALKTWFAGRYPGTENPYLLVLDAAIPGAAGARTLRNPELRRLRRTLNALQAQLDQAVQEAHYQQGFHIISAIMARIPPLLSRLDEQAALPLGQFAEYAVGRLLEWPSARLSPELNAARRDALTDWYLKPGFPQALTNGAIALLAACGLEADYYRQLREYFDRYDGQTPMLNLFLGVLAHRDMPEAVVRVLENSPLPPGDLVNALRSLQKNGYGAAAAQAADHFRQKIPSGQGHRKELEDIMLSQAEKDGDRALVTRLMQERYLQQPSPDLLARLKKAADPREWPTVRQELASALHIANNRNALLQLLSGENLQEELARELSVETDLALLHRYEERLLPEHQPAMRQRYGLLFDEHLKDHFGRQASIFVRNVIGSLLQRRHTDLAVDLVRDLIQRYPDRTTLAEELAELFPKVQRKKLFGTHFEPG
ncbi:MAG: hypothetical protein SFV52_15185 [Saprospiraceae bacterium]|nr:hypothetical protein [Saprospiraceae bacterium]